MLHRPNTPGRIRQKLLILGVKWWHRCALNDPYFIGTKCHLKAHQPTKCSAVGDGQEGQEFFRFVILNEGGWSLTRKNRSLWQDPKG
jgi:hypothetical protein